MIVKLVLKRENENVQIWSEYGLFKNSGCRLPASSSAALGKYSIAYKHDKHKELLKKLWNWRFTKSKYSGFTFIYAYLNVYYVSSCNILWNHDMQNHDSIVKDALVKFIKDSLLFTDG